jgi:hypothetical protein
MMNATLVAVMLVAPPVLVRVDVDDMVKLPGGASTPLEPLVLLVKAPASWVEKGTLTEGARKALLVALYGRSDWASTFEVKSLRVAVVDAQGLPAPAPGQRWFEVDGADAVVRRSGDFDEVLTGPGMKRLSDAADGTRFRRGPSVSDAKAVRAALESHGGLVKVPATLRKGPLGFETRGVQLGAVTFRADDTRLGVPVGERARGMCGEAASCTLWLVGRWVKGAEPTLEVTRVGSVVDANAEPVLWLDVP